MFFFTDSETCLNCKIEFVFIGLAFAEEEEKTCTVPVAAIQCPYCKTKHVFNAFTKSWDLPMPAGDYQNE